MIRDHFAVFLGCNLTNENSLDFKFLNQYEMLDAISMQDYTFVNDSDFLCKKLHTKYNAESKYFLKQNDILIKFRSNLQIMFIKNVTTRVLISDNFIIIRSNHERQQLTLWYLLNNRYKKLLISQFRANSRTAYLSISSIANVTINKDLFSIEENKINLYINLQRFRKLLDLKKDLTAKQIQKVLGE